MSASIPTTESPELAGFETYEESLALAKRSVGLLLRDLALQAKAVASMRERNYACGPDAGFACHWLTLSGTQGCGKTSLAERFYKAAKKIDPFAAGAWVTGQNEFREADRRPGMVWMHEKDFASRLKGGEFDLPERLEREWIVVIDDVGHAHDPSRYVADGLARLAEVRMGKWTIFTTNLSLPDLGAKVEPRLASRMIRDRNWFVEIKAGDYALLKR